MSVEDAETIDHIGIDPETKQVGLVITETREWNDPETHLSQLEAKLNAYLAFIEGGGIRKMYPKHKGKEVCIELLCQYVPPDPVRDMYGSIREFLKAAGWLLK